MFTGRTAVFVYIGIAMIIGFVCGIMNYSLFPIHFVSHAEFMGIPLVSVNISDQRELEKLKAVGEIAAVKSNTSIGWIAVGQIAVSPGIACGVMAVAPIAFGIFSFGLIAIGVLSFGLCSSCGVLAVIIIRKWSIGLSAIMLYPRIKYISDYRRYKNIGARLD